jgi:hypothetical protein
MEEFHNSPIGGHQGHEKTYYCIRQHFYFPKMKERIKRFVAQCFLCQSRKTPTMKRAGLMHSITPTGMFETIGIDFAGPYPETPEGCKYILVGICLFSKWIETTSAKEATAEAVVNFLIE